ncbi:hypothetical protein [Microvirga terricola]|uniref:Uncharacterized protein n=1 Tax=Microvirga terricola TaxID=2719797 RepID=A0ABX0VC87_9HYPH|nr:hypothetical protein [Microvirga terricola]NIX75447.1 hypothetical protein [Microvirga terricola]
MPAASSHVIESVDVCAIALDAKTIRAAASGIPFLIISSWLEDLTGAIR